MNEDFLINVDQLRKKGNLNLDLALSSDFLGIDQEGVHFDSPVDIQGEAYIVDDRLILHLDLVVPATVPCTICNGEASVHVKINNFYHIEEIKKLKTTIFDFSKVLREEILLEIPKFAECKDGNCPDREEMKHYLRPNKSS